ncbi:Uncharacterized protein PBTT_00687 [Plasmodiophora brassicae]
MCAGVSSKPEFCADCRRGDVDLVLEETSSADHEAMGDYFLQEWARRAEGVDSKSPDMSDVDGNYFLREWLESSDDDDGEAYPPSDDDVNEYSARICG